MISSANHWSRSSDSSMLPARPVEGPVWVTPTSFNMLNRWMRASRPSVPPVGVSPAAAEGMTMSKGRLRFW